MTYEGLLSCLERYGVKVSESSPRVHRLTRMHGKYTALVLVPPRGRFLHPREIEAIRRRLCLARTDGIYDKQFFDPPP